MTPLGALPYTESQVVYFLNRHDFTDSDTTNVKTFVECWRRYYRGDVSVSLNDKSPIEYQSELNLQAELTEQNLVRLLRWKDKRVLTHPTRRGPNSLVLKVVRQRNMLNLFRRGALTTARLQQVTDELFPGGIVWQLFLFHVARPWEWPIADQHVFRAYTALSGRPAPKTIAAFENYKTFFDNLSSALDSVDNNDRAAVVSRNKRLDCALMAFGQFLKKYNRA
jgi:hypothetical protein